MSHEITWAEPPPLWTHPGMKYVSERSGILQHPTIFRFSSDSFMDDFMNLVATEPQRLREFKVRPETWRGFTPAPTVEAPRPTSAILKRLGLMRRPDRNGVSHAGTSESSPQPAAEMPLKLYQPVHQRYYLAASSLVCRVPGLPDREVAPGRGERVGFVMRRLIPPPSNPSAPREDWEEHAWTVNEEGKAWQRVAPSSVDRLGEDEELLPMFGVNVEEAGRERRRLFAGMVPVGRREEYLGAPKGSPRSQPGMTSKTSRKILFRKEVSEPWKSLSTRADRYNRGPAPDGNEEEAAERVRLKLEREGLQTSSWLILLDFAQYLATYLPAVWEAVSDPSRAANLNAAELSVFTAMQNTTLSPNLGDRLQRVNFDLLNGARIYTNAVASSLLGALARFVHPDGRFNDALREKLEAVTAPYDRHSSSARAAYPAFLFPLADPKFPLSASVSSNDVSLTEERPFHTYVGASSSLTSRLNSIDRLAALVVRALPEDAGIDVPEPDVPAAAVAPANPMEGWFRIRCVYDRPACEPLHHAVVSEPTEPFELAGFFDPDAPARPIRIGLPIDTSPAGLRKFDRNTAFVISDILCGQINRFKGITLGDLVLSVLPWPFHKDLPVPEGGPCETGGGQSLGMICSLSIPIITICALIVLMIMVTLLDFIFRWIPYFITCFPIPGFGGKSDG